MKFIRISLALIVLGAALVASTGTPASAAESALDFRVAPAAGSQLSEGNDYFVLKMDPGESRTQAVEISNPSRGPLRVQLAAVDAATAQMGGVDYGSEQIDATATGSWITLEERTISLRPGESTKARFDVAIPADAVSGVHLGGLVIWVEGAEQKSVADAQATMNVQSRRVIALQVELPGAGAPALEIRGAQAEARPDGVYLGIDLFNSGRGFASGTGTVSIEGRDGIGSFTLDTVVPRTGTTFPFKWDVGAVPNGSYEVAIEIDYGVAIATWQGQVSVGPALQEDLRERGIGDAGGSLIPRGALVVAALIALLLFFFARNRRLVANLMSRLPRVSVSRPTRAAPPVLQRFPSRWPRVVPAAQAVFVPRSAEEQRCVPPPPPPPLPARPAPSRAGYSGAVGAGSFDY